MVVLENEIVKDQLRPGPNAVAASAVRQFSEWKVTVVPLQGAPPDMLVPGELRLGALWDSRLRVVEPIILRLSRDHDQVVAEAPQLDEFGFGSDMFEAVRDIQRAIAQLYFSLADGSERLGPDLQLTWAVLQRLVIRAQTPTT